MSKNKRKPRHKKAKKNSLTQLTSLGAFIRSVGCKGTDIDFYLKNGTDTIFMVVSDSLSPYDNYDPNTNMAHDGSNVTKLSRKKIIEELGGTINEAQK